MIIETSAAGYRQNLGVMLNQVQYRHDSVAINEDGKAVAARVNVRLFERICRMQGCFDELYQPVEAGFGGISEGRGLD